MRRTTGLLSFAVLLLGYGLSYGVMPTPEVIEKLKAEGKWEEFKALNESAKRRGLDQPDSYRITAGEHAPVVANLRALVILVDFSDNVASAHAVTDTAYFRDLLFSVNSPGQSLNDFYQENSFGNVTVTGDVVGWLRMPQLYSYYVNGQRGLGSYPQNAQKLAEDAAIEANLTGVDFSLYDNDGDNELDGFFVVHAGPGYEETGNLNQIHSHKWVLASTLNFDGVSISNYTMQPEEQGNFQPVNIGVFCHEFGHFFGLPDLYDIDGSSQGLDRWVLMAAGNYAKSDGSSPAHFGVWEKMKLGWINPTRVLTNLTNVSIPQIETDSVAYRLWTNGAVGSQYFLVENRQKTRFDAFLPGEGLMIYHVDDTKIAASNTQEWYPGFTSSGHYLVALEQADGLFELEKTNGPFASDNSDPWPGSLTRTNFDDLTVPDSRDYAPASTQVAVWNISPSDSLMTANLDVVWSRPNFVFLNKAFTDDGNNNGIPEGGENVNMFVTERNMWKTVFDAVYSVSCDDPDVTFTDSVVVVGQVTSGTTATNIMPITFSVTAGKIPRVADFYITVTSALEGYVSTDTVRIDIGPKQILIVDDDARLGPTKSLDSSHIIPVIDTMRVPFARWEVYTAGPPTTLNNYPMVLWYTGNVRTNLYSGTDTLLNPSEIAQLQSYLDNGGGLLLAGQQVARYLNNVNLSFLNNYLHADWVDTAGDLFAQGIDGDPITDVDSLFYFVLGGAGGAGNQDQAQMDMIAPRDSAVAILTEVFSSPSNISGIRYSGAYKLVFLGFGVEGIGDNMAHLGGMKKSLLIESVTNWLLSIPTAVGDEDVAIPQSFELYQNYPNPFNPSTVIRFNLGSSASRVTLKVFNTLGQQVRTLLDSDLPAGRHEVAWDGQDDDGSEVGSGVYFYRVESKNGTATRKMLLLC